MLNPVNGRKERIGKVYQMHANEREEIASVGAGQIVAVMGLKDTNTGHTLCDQAKPVLLESMTFPAPVIDVAIEPKTKGDQEKLGTAIQRLSDEDPTFTVKADEETGQTIIAGMGELHLEILVDRMKREFRVEATVGKPQVAYRETLRRKVEKHSYTHKKQTGGSGQFAKVVVSLEPNIDPETGHARGLRVREQRDRWSRAEGVHPLGGPGRSGGHGVRGARRLPDGRREVHPRGRRVPRRGLLGAGVQVAGNQAFKESARQAKPVLLEPMFAVEVVTPETFLGDVIGDIDWRAVRCSRCPSARGIASSTPSCRSLKCSGYVGDLRSKTSGQASYSMEFDSYAEVPQNVADEIIKKVRGE